MFRKSQWNHAERRTPERVQQADSGLCGSFRPRQAPATRATYFNNPDVLQKDQDLARVDYQVSEKFSSFFRWVNDYQKEQFQTGVWAVRAVSHPAAGSSEAGQFVVLEPGEHVHSHLAAETSSLLQSPVAASVDRGQQPGQHQTQSALHFPQLYPHTNITNSIPNVTTNTGPESSLRAGSQQLGSGQPRLA